ncbi:MAG TPA: YbaB/EbfC family nucleoid-associated protein [Pseudonocardiaceae bacterium]
MAEQRLTPQEQIDSVVAELRSRAAKIRENQFAALSTTGEAASHDGTVRATVDATGVLTALSFTPSLFDRSTPDKLARTVVATVQAAAAQARGKAAEAFQSLRSDGTGMLATAARETERWGVPAGSVPDVPNTATDPTGDEEPWQRQESRASRLSEQYPAEERHW